MNGDIPGVPIITLCGTQSLSNVVKEINIAQPIDDQSQKSLFPTQAIADYSKHMICNPVPETIQQLASTLSRLTPNDLDFYPGVSSSYDNSSLNEPLIQLLQKQNHDIFSNSNKSQDNYGLTSEFSNYDGVNQNSSHYVSNFSPYPDNAPFSQSLYPQNNNINENQHYGTNVLPVNGNGCGTINKFTISSPAQATSAPSSIDIPIRSDEHNKQSKFNNINYNDSIFNKKEREDSNCKLKGKDGLKEMSIKLKRIDMIDYNSTIYDDTLTNCSLSDKIKRAQRKRPVSYVENDFENNGCFNKKIKADDDWCSEQMEDNAYIPSSINEMIDSTSYKKFVHALEKVLIKCEDLDIKRLDAVDDISKYESIINRLTLSDLCNESAKLKGMSAMKQVSPRQLVKVMTILLLPIKMGCKLQPVKYNEQHDERQEMMWRDMLTEKVLMAVDAALTATHVMTSEGMSKMVYIEDVIERIVNLLQVQLTNTIYPEYDPVYRATGIISNMKQRRARAGNVTHRGTIVLYNKLVELIGDLAELVNIQDLPDTIVLHIASLAVSPFFVENIGDLQLASLKLVTSVFARYESLRQIVIEEILASLARLPSSKKNIRNYVVQGEDRIQMVTALVLELIQSVVTITTNFFKKSFSNEKGNVSLPDKELLVKSSFEKSKITASQFLQVFLQKCTTKGNEDQDYRPLFESFIQDLLLIVNKPQWPAAEMMLYILGNILVNHFSNKSVEMPMRTASLDYLGTVAARLRKDAVGAQSKEDTLDCILQRLHDSDSDDASSVPSVYNDDSIKYSKFQKNKKKKSKIRHNSDNVAEESVSSDKEEMNETDRIQELQKTLLDFIICNMHQKPALKFARQFYLAQWINDAVAHMKKTVDEMEKHQKTDTDDGNYDSSVVDNMSAVIEQCEKRKTFLLNEMEKKLDSFSTIGRRQTKLDYSSACLITRYLAANRPFSQSFDIYLFSIINVAKESAVAVRTKAIKCLGSVVEADPNVLARPEVHNLVKSRLLDPSTSVREAVVDLLGRFILVRPHLIPQYYPVLADRILDTGVSVRKRVIKIFRDICLEHPDFDKIPEICVKMIRRVNDEDGIKKLVNEVFQNMWLKPTDRRDIDRISQKVMHIVDVVAACNVTGFDWFEQLLINLLKKEESKQAELACIQIVDSLVENILNLQAQKDNNQRRLAATFQTLHLICKANAELLVNHITSIAYYLNNDFITGDDQTMLMSVIKIIEQVVPLLKHPNPNFMATIEENLVKLLNSGSTAIMQACISCLASCINFVTNNYTLIKDLFNRFYGNLVKIRAAHKPLTPFKQIVQLFRPLHAVGAICQHFDMINEPLSSDPELHRKVFELLFFYVLQFHDDRDEIKCRALASVGLLCCRHAEFMRENTLKSFYLHYLNSDNKNVKLRVRILHNLWTYLNEEENRMFKEQSIWKDEDLKELGDVKSGMASAIVQLFTKDILTSVLSVYSPVRIQASKLVIIILKQGLIHPAQCIPCLIAMATDSQQVNRTLSESFLKDFESNHPQIFHMKIKDGFKLSYELQKVIYGTNKTIRGIYNDSNGICTARNHFLYNLVKGSRQSRRAFVSNILKHFDDSNTVELPELIYFSDNLAHFPYQMIDEPLFIMHHIDMTVSVIGMNSLQTFREVFNMSVTEEVDLEADELIKKLPEDCSQLQLKYMACQGCLLLLVLKQHLKDMYGITDAKIQRYSPNESAKVYDRPFTRKNEIAFNPVQALKLVQSGPPPCHDEESRKALVLAYLNFKQLMMYIDLEEDIDPSTNVAKPSTVSLLNASYTSTNVVDETINSAIINIPNFPNTPVNTKNVTPASKKQQQRSRQSKLPSSQISSSTKKKKKKKKKKASRFSSSEESSDSDPDFLG